MLVLNDIHHLYPDGETAREVLTLPRWEIADGEQWALIGPSGSGKSTLLHCIAGLITPTHGTVTIDDECMSAATEEVRARRRGESIGYVLQQFNLLSSLTVMDNVRAGAYFGRTPASDGEITELLTQLGIAHLAGSRSDRLSMGEQQRTAIARALIKRPRYLIADEPTANLDRDNTKRIIDTLLDYSRTTGATLIVATHDPAVMAHFARQMQLPQGGI